MASPSSEIAENSTDDESALAEESAESLFSRVKAKACSLTAWAGSAVYSTTESSVTCAQNSGFKLRAKFSSVTMILQLEALYELFLILRKQTPFSLKVDHISVPFGGPTFKTPTAYLPNPCSATTYKPFWEPIACWAVYLLIIPLIFSFFINFTAGKSTSARARHIFDPVTYNIVKVLSAYMLFVQLNTATDTFVAGSTTVTASHSSVPKLPFSGSEPLIRAVLGNIPYIGSAIGTLAALYVAILF